jgi:transposase, IS30 family
VNDTRIATLVERNTHFAMLVKILRKRTTNVVAALAKHIRKLPEKLRRSLTWDQGKKMNAHKHFTVASNVQVYFCDLRSPWQRGSHETPTVRCVSTSREEPTSRASLRVI